ncbi:MAG TPA: ABC transporter ATP-binding protein [Polyangiaceae bacterium]|jgi:ATP-binding cassette subfamily B protein
MTLRLVWRSSPTQTVALAVLTLVGGLVPLGIAYAGKRIVDAVVAHDRGETLRWVLFELGLVVALALVQRGLALIRNILGLRLGVDINVSILEKAQGLELHFFEDPEFYDKLTRARREASSRPISLITGAFGLVQSLITLVGYGALLVRFSGWAVLALCVATIPATIAEMRFSKLAFKIRNWRSPESRRLMYLEYVLANDEHAKEVKLFGVGPMLLDRYKVLSEEFYDEDRKLYLRRAKWTQVLSLIGTGTFYAAYAAMAIMTAAGALTLGNMTMYVLAFRQGQQAFQSALGGIGDIYEHNLYMSNLWEFLAIADAGAAARLQSPGTAAAEQGAKGLVLEDLGFRYPGKDAWALRHVDLTIAPGASLALVGQNGAGKTTLVKLLTRLYEPTEGRIVLDGRDLREWDPLTLRKRFGVLFQDFNQYQLKVRENVGMGSVEHMDEEPRVERAVERGGATDVVSALPSGLDAPLGRWFQDGTELSGGQWQKIALARAFMREEADILVLDEPTAALDAEAEHAVFTRFRELAQGRTTVVISHRFPTVRMASTIVVLDHGTVAEKGSHEELVALGGTYARMFALQAEGYR